jgi:hypothetical protein
MVSMSETKFNFKQHGSVVVEKVMTYETAEELDAIVTACSDTLSKLKNQLATQLSFGQEAALK